MSVKHCLRAGEARACGDCKHNPSNAPDDRPRRETTPPVSSGGRCIEYVQVIRPAVRR